jgi:hypothetical protein
MVAGKGASLQDVKNTARIKNCWAYGVATGYLTASRPSEADLVAGQTDLCSA